MSTALCCDVCAGPVDGPPFGPRGATWCIHCWLNPEIDREAPTPAAQATKADERKRELEEKLEDARVELRNAEIARDEAEADFWDCQDEVRRLEMELRELTTGKPAAPKRPANGVLVR